MFNFRKNFVKKLESKIEGLEKERLGLKAEVEDLKLKKKISEEDIKHMVKMKEERLAIDHEKRVAAIERESEVKIAGVKDEYRDKVEQSLETRAAEIKEMYGEILQRLPKIAVRLKGEVE